jgi:hypothetical protein
MLSIAVLMHFNGFTLSLQNTACGAADDQTFNVEIKFLRATLPDRYFTGNFASWTVHFVNIYVKNQQMHQLFIQFINYVW